MQFGNPYILYALFALLIPIIIHLFKFRRYKKVYFSNVKMLKDIQAESEKKSRLKEILILISRLLCLSFLIFAFAQPYIPLGLPQDKITKNTYVSIYLDNSYSMQLKGENGELLDIAKQRVGDILDALDATQPIQILTSNLNGYEQQFYDKEKVRELLQEVELSASTPDFEEIRTFQDETFDNLNIDYSLRQYYYVSDFQESTLRLEDTNPFYDSLVSEKLNNSVFLPLSAGDIANISIDSVWISTPILLENTEAEINVRVSNRSSKGKNNIALRVFTLDSTAQNSVKPEKGNLQSVINIDLDKGETKDFPISMYLSNSGNIQAYAHILDYPMVYDDKYYFNIDVTSAPNILHIYEFNPNPYIKRLFAEDKEFHYKERDINNIDYSEINLCDLIILESQNSLSEALIHSLNDYLKARGNLVLLPPLQNENKLPYEALTKALINDTYTTKVEEKNSIKKLNTDNIIFKTAIETIDDRVDLPTVDLRYYLPKANNIVKESLMSFSNSLNLRDDFLRLYNTGGGRLFLFSTPIYLEYTNFVNHYSFVLSFINMALYKSDFNLGSAIIKSKKGIKLNSKYKGDFVKIENIENIESVIPLIRAVGSDKYLFNYEGLNMAANARIVDEENNILQYISLNYDRKESDLEYYTEDEIREYLHRIGIKNIYFINAKEQATIDISNINKGIDLWKIFIIFALLFVLVEMLFIRTKS